MGRAARNASGHIMYADKITDSMRIAIDDEKASRTSRCLTKSTVLCLKPLRNLLQILYECFIASENIDKRKRKMEGSILPLMMKIRLKSSKNQFLNACSYLLKSCG